MRLAWRRPTQMRGAGRDRLVLAVTLVMAAAVMISGRPSASAGVTVVVPGCAVAPSDVVGWWRLDGDLLAEIGPDLIGTADFEPALIGQGGRFRTSSAAEAASFPPLSGEVSVDLWIRPDATPLVQSLVTRWDPLSRDDSTRSFALSLIGDDLVWMTDEQSTRRPDELRVTTTGLYDLDYHHVAATRSQTEMAIYVDGTLVGSKPVLGGTLNPAASTPFRLASKAGTGDPLRYYGVIDEAAVYGRALTATEVDDLVAAGPNAKCTATDGIVGPGLQFPGDLGGVDPVISADGRYVVFRSRSSNLFPIVNDPLAQTPGADLDLFDNYRDDIVLLDTKNTKTVTADDTLELISVDSNGLGGGLDSAQPAITPTGSHVVFTSISDDLVADDTLPGRDLFVRDRVAGTTARVSVRSDGSQPEFTATGLNNDSRDPSISDNGLVVAFESTNRDLAPEANPVPGDTWQTYDIYVRDVSDPSPGNHVTERLTVGVGAAKADGSSTNPIISPDGRYVWFSSLAANLVPGDTNGRADLFVYDRQTDTTSRLDVTGATGQPLDGDLTLADVSPDGRWISFSSDASTISVNDPNGHWDAFVLDAQTLTVHRASPPSADGDSFASSVSANGRYVLVESAATNLVPDDSNDDSDLFMADRVEGTITRVSVDPGGQQRPGRSGGSSASAGNGSLTYFYQVPGSGLFTIWRTDLQVT